MDDHHQVLRMPGPACPWCNQERHPDIRVCGSAQDADLCRTARQGRADNVLWPRWQSRPSKVA